MVCEEEVGGVVTHEMEEKPAVVSQAEGVTSISPFCRIPRRLFCPVTGSNEGIFRNTTSDSEYEEPGMFGDFDGSANKFWTLYREEAGNYDNARIFSLKEYMGNVVIFVCSYPICACVEPGHADAQPHRLVYIPLSSLDSSSIAGTT